MSSKGKSEFWFMEGVHSSAITELMYKTAMYIVAPPQFQEKADEHLRPDIEDAIRRLPNGHIDYDIAGDGVAKLLENGFMAFLEKTDQEKLDIMLEYKKISLDRLAERLKKTGTLGWGSPEDCEKCSQVWVLNALMCGEDTEEIKTDIPQPFKDAFLNEETGGENV